MRSRESSKAPLAVLLLFTVLGSTLAFLPALVLAQNPSCGDTITTNTTLSADIGPCSTVGVSALRIGANGITLDCAGHTISGPGPSAAFPPDGVAITSHTGVSVTNCIATGFGDGFILGWSSNGNTLSGNTASGNVYNGFVVSGFSSGNTLSGNMASGSNFGFQIFNSSGNILSGNTANGNDNGFLLSDSSNSNTLSGNTANGNNNGFLLAHSSGNTLSENTGNNNNLYGYVDQTTGSGTAGTANAYASNTCSGNGVAGSSPSGLCKTSPRVTTTLSHLAIIAGQLVYDTAILSGATKNAGGTVTYEYFSGGTCSGTPAKVNTVQVTNGVVPKSASHVFSKVGTYGWKAIYSGDTNNYGATSQCEKLTVLKTTTPPTHTVISCTKSSFMVGTRITCTAIVTGGYMPRTGTIAWSKASGTGGVTFSSKTCTLMSGRCWVTIRGTITGSFTVKATYSGDPHNPWSSGTKVLTIT